MRGMLLNSPAYRSLTPGTSVKLRGILGASKGKEQAVELQVEDVKILGACDPDVGSIADEY